MTGTALIVGGLLRINDVIVNTGINCLKQYCTGHHNDKFQAAQHGKS